MFCYQYNLYINYIYGGVSRDQTYYSEYILKIAEAKPPTFC